MLLDFVRDMMMQLLSRRLARPGGVLLSRRSLILRQCSVSHNAPAPQEVLKGTCSCGSVSFEAHGPSAINFVSHSSLARAASGAPYLTASGFKRDQVYWQDADQKRALANAARQDTQQRLEAMATQLAEAEAGRARAEARVGAGEAARQELDAQLRTLTRYVYILLRN